MIPLGDENPTRKTPYVMYTILALNILVYLIDMLGPRSQFGSFLWNWSMIPYSVLNDVRVAPVFTQQGQLIGAQKLPGVGFDPQWITIFTSMFMHGGLLHIGSNMLYLWIFGNNIEDILGHFKFLMFYLAGGVLAAVAHIASDTNSFIPTVGASGAIAAVLGAYLIVFPHARIRTLIMLGWFWDVVEIPAIYVLGVWFLLQLTGVASTGGTLGGGVAYWAHIGGFAAGALLILLFGGPKLGRGLRSRRLERYRDDDERPYPFRPWE